MPPLQLLSSSGQSRPLRFIEKRVIHLLPIAVALGLLASALEAASIALFVRLTLVILSPMSNASDSPGDVLVMQIVNAIAPRSPVLAISILIVALVMGKSLAQVANSMFISSVEGKLGRDVRDALASRVLHLDFSFFLKNDSERLATIIHTDSWQVSDAIRTIFTIGTAGAAVFVFAFLLVLAEWRLALIVLAGVALVRLIQWWLSRRIAQLGRLSVASNHRLAAQMIQIVRAIRVVRLFGQEPREVVRFRLLSEGVRASMFKTAQWTSITMPVVEVVLAGLILLVLVCAGYLAVPLATTAAFLVLLYRVQPPLMAIGHSLVQFSTLRGSIEAVEWLLDQPILHEAADRTSLSLDEETITFERVGYAYPRQPDEPVLNGLDIAFPPGSVTALVGSSGAGKSTIINLLCRLVEPSSGRICAGSMDVGELDQRWWREQIALAGQDVDMILGTVADNIAYGCPIASKAEIENAAIHADAHDFICGLPNGYRTELGSMGFGLSGGQRQRIGLARALLRRPEILILDEATNAVDGPAERTIMTLLGQHRRFGRAIVISHRRSTLSMCDRGIVIENGMVAESGPLNELAWYKREVGCSLPNVGQKG